MKSYAYLKDKMQVLKSLILTRSIVSPEICSLSIDNNFIQICYINNATTPPELKVFDSVPYPPDAFGATLTKLVNKHRLTDKNCHWILPTGKYQLLLLEELPVTDAEFQSAIRWKVKELIKFPIEDALIDTFKLPQAKIPGSKSTMMVAITQLSYLNQFTHFIHQSGLKLTEVTIPELSLKNITSLYEEAGSSTALIYLQDKSTSIIISNDKTFYLTRKLDWGLDKLSVPVTQETPNPFIDQLALELQRSLDYYQSQWRTFLPSRILLASAGLTAAEIPGYLSTRLGIQVQPLVFSEMVNVNEQVEIDKINQGLATFGAALLLRGSDHDPKN